jgi:hypothetical protein
MQSYILFKFFLVLLPTISYVYTGELTFTIPHDPIMQCYINTLYNNALTSRPIYVLQNNIGIFLESENNIDHTYLSTGSIQPKLQLSETETGICISYGTYLLIHEVYLEYLLKNPEAIVYDITHISTAQIEKDTASNRLELLNPLMAEHLTNICGENAEIFVDHAMQDYCSHPSSIVKNSNESGTHYIISPLLGEIVFKQMQQKFFIPEAFEDSIYLCCIFNDRSHWIALDAEQISFFDTHKDIPGNGGFLNKEQVASFFQTQQWSGLLDGLIQEKEAQIYIDLSGFMSDNNRYAFIVYKTQAGDLCFIINSYLMHLITKVKSKPFFVAITPTIVESLKSNIVDNV